MGHVLLAAPAIERFHLHEQVGRRLMRRGHRVTLLATDPVTFRCYEVHGLPTRLLEPSRAEDTAGFPVQEFAARDARLTGSFPPDRPRLARLSRRLARRTRPLVRLFETEIPDVVVFTHGRSGLHRLIDAVAHSFGCPTTHLGDGLLPGTMQRDAEGIDGDSSASRRSAGFYRGVRADRALCDAALAGLLGDVDAPPVARRFVHPPDLLDALACLSRARSLAAFGWTLGRLRAWRTESERPLPHREQDLAGMPDRPFVAILAQRPDDPRVRLDTDDRCPSPAELVLAVRRATQSVDPGLEVVAVRAPGPADEALEALRTDGVVIRRPGSAATVAAMAATVVTVNHSLAFAGVLAGTPVIHLGRTLYGIPGATHRTTIENLRTTLTDTLAARPALTLRARVATHLLTVDHLWCEPEAPDPNGLRGIVTHVEDVLWRAAPEPEPTPYRPGPGWPLLRDA